MIPSSVTGVLAFLASVGPGYVYVKIADRWRPYVQRTALREAAEMVVTGSLATLVAVVFALVVGQVAGFLDVNALARHPGSYLITHPVDASLALLVVLVTSYGLAWFIADKAPGKGPEVFPDSGWYAAFERMRPTNHVIIATAELRDGRKLTGLVQSFTAEQTPIDERELTLKRSATSTMKVLLADGYSEELREDFIILRGSDIVYVAASFVSAD